MELDIIDSNSIVTDIINAIKDGKNIELTGSGGTGKSYMLKQIAIYLRKIGKQVCCTATTGVAAINLNMSSYKLTGSTLHSWAGVGTAQLDAKRLCGRVLGDTPARTRWENTDVLIVDEVSMLGKNLFEKLDYIGRQIRKNPKCVFGGIQLIFSGDFLQLPPVKDDWVFFAKGWEKLNLASFVLTEPKRYDDIDYFNLLMRIRSGSHTSEDITTLQSRVSSYKKLNKILKKENPEKVIKPTILYSKKVDVNRYNEMELAKLPGKAREFIAKDIYTNYDKKTRNIKVRFRRYENMLNDSMAKIVRLKIGAQVMLKCNISVADGLVNGTRGVVVAMSASDPNENIITVRFLNSKILRVKAHTWTIEDKNGCASRSQIPFILAWAYTIHKCQGATIDYAVCDLGHSVFEYGQAYVALSRVRNLKGLFIAQFVSSSIKVHPDALDYYSHLEANHNGYNDNKTGVSDDTCYSVYKLEECGTARRCNCGNNILYRVEYNSEIEEYLCEECLISEGLIEIETKYEIDFPGDEN